MIEFVRWQVRLFLADYREAVGERIIWIMSHSRPWIGDESRFDRLVDRLSPWDHETGYRNLWLRRFLYTARSPLVFIRLRSLELSLGLLQRITPYTGPGKYEGMLMPSTRLKAEWLDEHSEYADQWCGDLTIYPLCNWLFAGLDVPWSRQPESWVLERDEMGFVIALQYENVTEAEIAYGGAEYRFDKAVEEAETPKCDLCGEPFEDGGEGEDWNGDTGNHFSCEREARNPEGDPTLNGAFA